MTRTKPRAPAPPDNLTELDVSDEDEDQLDDTDEDLPVLDVDIDSTWDPTVYSVNRLGAAYLDRATGCDGARRHGRSLAHVLAHL